VALDFDLFDGDGATFNPNIDGDDRTTVERRVHVLEPKDALTEPVLDTILIRRRAHRWYSGDHLLAGTHIQRFDDRVTSGYKATLNASISFGWIGR
jgi:hypothetical protein